MGNDQGFQIFSTTGEEKDICLFTGRLKHKAKAMIKPCNSITNNNLKHFIFKSFDQGRSFKIFMKANPKLCLTMNIQAGKALFRAQKCTGSGFQKFDVVKMSSENRICAFRNSGKCMPVQ